MHKLIFMKRHSLTYQNSSKSSGLKGQSSISSPFRANLSDRHTSQSSISSSCKADKALGLKGQSSMELLVTFGVVLAFTVPVLLLLLSVSQFGFERSAVVQAQATAKLISDNINEVYLQGDGAQRVLLVNLPANTRFLNVTSTEVIIVTEISSGNYEAASPIFANMSQKFSFQEKSGLFPLSVVMEGGQVVLYER